jgi:hypothetical protein
LYNAVNYIKNQVPTSLNISSINSNRVDNVCFIVQGDPTDWNTLLWPHRWQLDSKDISINGKRVWNYNLQIEKHLNHASNGQSSVLCHEMGHTFGAPDLYHYNHDGGNPVGSWDVMAYNQNPPQHTCAYMKWKYGGWISSIPEITSSGTYRLQPLTSSFDNCYKIPIAGSSQYLVLEYRKKTGTFESSLPGSGLIIYRINESLLGNGNASGEGHGGKKDKVYVFRPGGTISPPPEGLPGDIYNAYFSQTAGRTVFSNSTDPFCFTAPNEDYANIYIKNIRENSFGTLTFDVRFCDGDDIIYSNPNYLPHITNASNSIQTQGIVIVNKPKNVFIFEAGNEVILNSGFEVQKGCEFQINMNECGQK